MYEYDVSTAWDISTATHTGTTLATQDTAPRGLAWKPDGTQLWEIGYNSDQIYEYDLASASTPAPLETTTTLAFAPSSVVVEDTTAGDLSVSYTITDSAANSVTVADADVGTTVDASVLTAGQQTIRATLDTPNQSVDDALVDFAVFFA